MPAGKRTVCFFVPSFAAGGAEKVMILVASHLDRDRFSPTLVALSAEGPLRSRVPDDLPVVDLATPRLRRAIPKVYRYLRQAGPDRVLSTLGYLNLALLAVGPHASPGSRFAVREANILDATIRHFPAAWAGSLAYRLLYRRAEAVICNAEAVGRQLRDHGVSPQRLHVIPNPVDIETVRRNAGFVERSGPGRRFIAAGRLTRQKGFDRLVDWFKGMPDTDRLTVYGDGEERAALERLIRAENLESRISLPGYAENPFPEIAAADAFLMPSRWEGMPNAALEALALGVPVIATAGAGGLPDLQREVPEASLAIAEDGDGFVAAMKRIPPTSGGGLRPSALPKRFELDTVVGRYAEVLA